MPMTTRGKAKPSDRVGFTTFSWRACKKCRDKDDCDIKDHGETDRLTLSHSKGTPLKTTYLTCNSFEEADWDG